MKNGTKSFLSRVVCEFLDRWKPDVCHEAAAEMSPSDGGEVIELGSTTVTDKLFGSHHNVFSCS